jgi:hypothetical protein
MYLISFLVLALLDSIAVSVSAVKCYDHLSKNDFPNCNQLSQSIALHWSLSSDSATITFGVDSDVPSDNWLGIGLSDMGGMRGTDMWLLLRKNDGSYFIQDSFSTDYATPVADDRQDITLVSPPSGNGNLVYTFKRAVVSCDSQDRSIIKGVQANIVWAYGSTSVTKTPLQHSSSNRGDAKLMLLPDPAASASDLAKDTQQLEIRKWLSLQFSRHELN